jgi:hypothetical protein
MLRHPFPVVLVLLTTAPLPAADLGTSGFADSGGVKIHYRTLGSSTVNIINQATEKPAGHISLAAPDPSVLGDC